MVRNGVILSAFPTRKEQAGRGVGGTERRALEIKLEIDRKNVSEGSVQGSVLSTQASLFNIML